MQHRLENDVYHVTAVWLIRTANDEQEAMEIAEKLGVGQASSVKAVNVGEPSLMSKEQTGPMREDL